MGDARGCHAGIGERIVLAEKYLLRFLKRVIFDTNGAGCWEWAGHAETHGYCLMKYKNRRFYAHRMAYMHWVGPLEAGQCVLHSCDNRICVNPAHLSAGTQRDNIHDAVAKGRMTRGEAQHDAKLTESDVAGVLASVASGERTLVIANRYGVSSMAIWRIATGRTWRHVTGLSKPSR